MKGGAVLEQRGQLGAGGAAQGGVDLLEHAPRGEPLAQASRGGMDRGGGLPGRQGAALGVYREHGQRIAEESAAVSAGGASTPTGPAPAKRQPVSQAPVRSSAMIVTTWDAVAAMSG